MGENSKKDSKDKPASATKAKGQMWYKFYIEPYFDRKDKAMLKKCIASYTTKDLSGVLKGDKIQPNDFPILLPFLLSDSKFDVFVQNYLNIGLQHRRNFSNSQNMIRANIAQLDILAGGGGIISTTIL